MGGANQYRPSSTKRVNVNICGRVPSSDWNLYKYQVSCVLVLRLLSYASSTRRKLLFLQIIYSQNWFLHFVHGVLWNTWYTDYTWHVVCCEAIESHIDLKLNERSGFPNVWGEYKNHIAIPIYRVLLYLVISGSQSQHPKARSALGGETINRYITTKEVIYSWRHLHVVMPANDI